MRKPLLIVCILWAMLLPLPVPAAEAPHRGPQAYLPQRAYEFSPAVEGSQVQYQFIIYNRGDAPLAVLDIEPDCACTTASGTQHIPPGQKGYIKVKVNTDGFGGMRIQKSLRIETNDPGRPVIVATVSGMVEKFVEIRPERIHLAGPAGRPLSAEVEVIPRKEYPFTVKHIEAKRGNFITCALTRPASEENGRYVIRIETKKEAKGRYIDVIYIVTDSDIQPKIPIYVTGVIE